MKKYFIFAVMLAFAVSGCAKKSEPEDLSQDAGTGTVATEFTLMQDSMPKATTVEPAQLQPSEMAAVSDLAAPAAPADPVPAVLGEPTTKEIQQALKNANFYTGKIDGDFGPKTKKAVRDFQDQNGLKADGKVGPKTWSKLYPFLTQGSAEPTLTED